MFAPSAVFASGSGLDPSCSGDAASDADASPAADFPRIGLIGFGAFGRLIARHAPAGARLLAFDPAPGAVSAFPPTSCQLSGASLEETASCPLVVLAAPVAATATICRQIAPWLRPGTLVVDVGSVKMQPVADMVANLPEHVEIAGLHPLFGPQSAAEGLAGLRLVVCPARGRRVFRLAAVLKAAFGLETQFATPDDHDREMAMVQGVTHMVARLVASLDERPTRMATRSHALLMQAVDMVRRDNPAVFDAIALRNPFVAGVQEQFFEAASALRKDLASRRAALADMSPGQCGPVAAAS